MARATSLSDEIDALLERYLHLLDTYTRLREELITVQSAIHQHIARANFSADRGIRYGQDLYDERMQASRLCRITTPVSFAVAAQEHNSSADGEDRAEGKTASDGSKKTKAKKDPIRMFGILTPQSLRMAQAGSVKMVEEIMPKILSTDAEMKDVEIQIRRARKHKAKAEVAKAKNQLEEERQAVVV